MKVGVAYMNICISKCLKEELAWAIDKWLRVISYSKKFTTKKLQNKAVLI